MAKFTLTNGPDTFPMGQDNSGNDTIRGLKRDDDIDGGTGNDKVIGGKGDDDLFGNEGDDRLFGGAGDDFIRGGSGEDFIFGGDDNDNLKGDVGNDRLNGGDGADRVAGGAGSDSLTGGLGSDEFIIEDSGPDPDGFDIIETIQDFSEEQGDSIDLRGFGPNLDSFREFRERANERRDADGDGQRDDVVVDLGDGQVLRILDTSLAELKGNVDFTNNAPPVEDLA